MNAASAPAGESLRAGESVVAVHPCREALLFFAASLALCMLGYLAAAVPGRWFPGVSASSHPADRLLLARGTGGIVEGDLVVSAVDAAGTALITIETDFRSRDFLAVAWDASNVADQAKVSLLWRNDYAPARLNSMPLVVASGRLLQASPAKDPNWIGRIRGLALVIQGPLPAPVRVHGVAIRPMGAVALAGDRIREWTGFEGFSGTSINSVTGGADVQELPLPVLLATAVALAGLAWFGLARVRRRTAVLPAVLMTIFVSAWLVQDTRWTWDLARQTIRTARLYAGGDARARHLAAEDGALFAFIETVRAKLPPPPARIFMVADAHYFRSRGAYHLFPHNVHFEPYRNAIPVSSQLRPGDYFVVYQRQGVEFEPGAQRLRWDGGAPVPAELLVSEPGAALYRIL